MQAHNSHAFYDADISNIDINRLKALLLAPPSGRLYTESPANLLCKMFAEWRKYGGNLHCLCSSSGVGGSTSSPAVPCYKLYNTIITKTGIKKAGIILFHAHTYVSEVSYQLFASLSSARINVHSLWLEMWNIFYLKNNITNRGVWEIVQWSKWYWEYMKNSVVTYLDCTFKTGVGMTPTSPDMIVKQTEPCVWVCFH